MIPVAANGQRGGEEACLRDCVISSTLILALSEVSRWRAVEGTLSGCVIWAERREWKHLPPKMNRPAMAPPKFLTSPFIVMVMPQASPMTEIHVCGATYIRQIWEGTSNRP